MTHRLFASAVLASTLLAGAAGVAAAQPSTATPAPQTHDWNDVSHINGQLVPVGESNSYEKEFRKTNVSSNPIGWMVGFYGLSVSHAINDHIAIRGDANYYSPVDTDLTGTELGIGAPIYLRRTYQGAFLEPGAIIRHTKYEYSEDGGGATDESTTIGPQMLFGWHWTWDSGLNVAMAAGLGRDLEDDDDGEGDDEPVFFNGYFRVGYAF
jgi:hypothetical protein